MKALSNEQAQTIRDVIDAGLTKMPEAALEKDIHLTDVLHALKRLPTDANLVFCGGTSLSKCFQAINRMSEDVDFKFHIEDAVSITSGRKARSVYKNEIQEHLNASGFDTSIRHQENGNLFFSFEVRYESKFEKRQSLRESILLEFTHVAGKPHSVTRPIREIINEAQSIYPDLGEIECLTIEQTIAEKVLSFLRRAPDRSLATFDPRIVRHIYDIHALTKLGSRDDESIARYFELAISHDESRYGLNRLMLKQSLESLQQSKANYAGLHKDFVVDLTTDAMSDFDECWQVFVDAASELLKN